MKYPNKTFKLVFMCFMGYLIIQLFEYSVNKKQLSLNSISKQTYLESAKLSNEEIQISESLTLNPGHDFCSANDGHSLLIITFVIIAPHFFSKRNEIRSTWGNKKFSDDFRVIFILGQSNNLTVNQLIKNEQRKNNDILQIANLIDNYYIMTLKIMKAFKWISIYCSNAKFILRINDDVILNTQYFIDHFKRLPYKKNQMFGFAFYGARPARNQGHKFYVSVKDYPREVYDDYIDGI